jgi:hypothetical protein
MLYTILFIMSFPYNLSGSTRRRRILEKTVFENMEPEEVVAFSGNGKWPTLDGG